MKFKSKKITNPSKNCINERSKEENKMLFQYNVESNAKKEHTMKNQTQIQQAMENCGEIINSAGSRTVRNMARSSNTSSSRQWDGVPA
ncbi:hypothetical protein Bhyg_15188 [Pseudolycoriella hygida]|uniref:Uncharacterized protein n=1 Tax=Pseudolycoriella hygida TaxID=35572 RepID=A0A9Q0RXV3_9DIPT|nr:hypothetical protein Bhyg_15188 [Pseudolycoriella hygida]